MDIQDLSTPALLLERDILCRNLDRMAARARAFGVSLRPHIKTHKSLEIAGMQLECGASGLTVATLTEGVIFAEAGFGDITHAFPLDQSKITKALDLAEHTTLRVTVDDLSVAEALARAAAGRKQSVHVWLKVDCGYHRAGVDPMSTYAVQLARFLDSTPHLDFDGLLTHAGHAYKASSREQIGGIAERERMVMLEFSEKLLSAGISVASISIGSTPTMSVAKDLSGVMEIRPGNYAFYDRTQVMLGSCGWDDCALSVLATVVSRQPGQDHAVVDAGALALSLDPGPIKLDPSPNYGTLARGMESASIMPSLRIVSLSQEHGIVQGLAERDLEWIKVGAKVRILPNHSCLTAALFDEYMVVEGSKVVDRWEIRRSRS